MHLLFTLLLLGQTCGPQGCPQVQSYGSYIQMAPAQQSMRYCPTGTCAQQSMTQAAAIQYHQAPRYAAPVTYGPWVPASQYVAPTYTSTPTKRVIRTTERRPTAEPGPPLDPIPGFSFYKGSSG